MEENYKKKWEDALSVAWKIYSGEGVPAPEGWTVLEVVFPELRQMKEAATQTDEAFGIIRSTAAALTEIRKKKESMKLPPFAMSLIAKNDGEPIPETEEAIRSYGWAIKFLTNTRIPKFRVGDVMRTLEEAEGNVTDGLPVVISVGDGYYGCTNEIIPFSDQDDYEYPPMNRKDETDRFGTGDWIISKTTGDVVMVTSTDEYSYFCKNQKGQPKHILFEKENEWRKWTPDDAVDGDILTSGRNVLIFSCMDGDDVRFHVCVGGPDGNCEVRMRMKIPKEGIRPATKEERDRMLKDLKSAGYTWDFDRYTIDVVPVQ